jgi:hypothetical protein
MSGTANSRTIHAKSRVEAASKTLPTDAPVCRRNIIVIEADSCGTIVFYVELLRSSKSVSRRERIIPIVTNALPSGVAPVY